MNKTLNSNEIRVDSILPSGETCTMVWTDESEDRVRQFYADQFAKELVQGYTIITNKGIISSQITCSYAKSQWFTNLAKIGNK